LTKDQERQRIIEGNKEGVEYIIIDKVVLVLGRVDYQTKSSIEVGYS